YIEDLGVSIVITRFEQYIQGEADDDHDNEGNSISQEDEYEEDEDEELYNDDEDEDESETSEEEDENDLLAQSRNQEIERSGQYRASLAHQFSMDENTEESSEGGDHEDEDEDEEEDDLISQLRKRQQANQNLHINNNADSENSELDSQTSEDSDKDQLVSEEDEEEEDDLISQLRKQQQANQNQRINNADSENSELDSQTIEEDSDKDQVISEEEEEEEDDDLKICVDLKRKEYDLPWVCEVLPTDFYDKTNAHIKQKQIEGLYDSGIEAEPNNIWFLASEEITKALNKSYFSPDNVIRLKDISSINDALCSLWQYENRQKLMKRGSSSHVDVLPVDGYYHSYKVTIKNDKLQHIYTGVTLCTPFFYHISDDEDNVDYDSDVEVTYQYIYNNNSISDCDSGYGSGNFAPNGEENSNHYTVQTHIDGSTTSYNSDDDGDDSDDSDDGDDSDDSDDGDDDDDWNWIKTIVQNQ
ncbi:hypothetical protein H4219_005805, partial [Mycoemilia scoparia]